MYFISYFLHIDAQTIHVMTIGLRDDKNIGYPESNMKNVFKWNFYKL